MIANIWFDDSILGNRIFFCLTLRKTSDIAPLSLQYFAKIYGWWMQPLWTCIWDYLSSIINCELAEVGQNHLIIYTKGLSYIVLKSVMLLNFCVFFYFDECDNYLFLKFYDCDHLYVYAYALNSLLLRNLHKLSQMYINKQ